MNDSNDLMFDFDRFETKEITAESSYKPIGSTFFIAVGGPERRTGATYSVLQIAMALAEWGYRVGAFERNASQLSPNVYHLYAEGESLHGRGGCRFRNIDIYPYGYDDLKFSAVFSNYDFVILDFGQLLSGNEFTPYMDQFLRSNLQIVTTGSSVWDFDRLTAMLGLLYSRDIAKRLEVLLNFADARRFGEFEGYLSAAERTEYQIRFHHNPFIADVYSTSAETRKTIQKILNEMAGIKGKSLWKKWRGQK
ncbi:hypothetical protein ACFSR7_06175 [Cohnella sp. GCM10020058]|uniref:hypothetical protein n=1 Tax=Cohnella sp. GCM10020058 TaxID=3317330 RepID=UPI0036400AAC